MYKQSLVALNNACTRVPVGAFLTIWYNLQYLNFQFPPKLTHAAETLSVYIELRIMVEIILSFHQRSGCTLFFDV